MKAARPIAVGLFALGIATSAQATVLTFDVDPPVNNFEALDQDYGDRVTSTTMPGNFLYGENGEGFTPNINVAYVGNSVEPTLWTTGYGDLTNVLFENNDGFGVLDIVFTADSGFNAVLHRWDMAAFGADLQINSVQVLDSVGNSLFFDNNVTIDGTTRTLFDFVTPFEDDVLTLRFNSSNLGGQSDEIAIDNITFSQSVVPLPPALALYASGLALIGWLRRRQ